MEVFKVFATMSLMDMISGPLGSISEKMKLLGQGIDSLGGRMGKLAVAMAPVALAAALVLGGLGFAVAGAADFEQAMSAVKAAASATSEEMKLLEANAMQLGADTSFSARQAAEAQESLAKAGLKVTEIIAAMPGTLAMAAAGGIGLAQAAEYATDTMKTFGMAAGDIGKIGDVMAKTANTASTDINLLGQTFKNSATTASSLRVSLVELSAMSGKLSDMGIKGSEAGTQLNTMLLRLSAPSADATKQIKKLGLTISDAQGNMLPIFDILGQLESKLAGMGDVKKAAILKEIFGDDAIKSVNALLKTGTSNLREYATMLEDSTGSAAETAAIRLDNFKGSLEAMGGSWETLMIKVGKIFLPLVTDFAQGITGLINVISDLAGTELGSWLLGLLAGLAAVIVVATALSGAIWLVTAAVPMLTTALAPLAAAVMAITWPVWLVIAALGALYLAYRNNFGGMADTLDRWWSKISLVGRGVMAVFSTLTGGVGEIKGQLAKDIEAAGLTGLVTTVGRIVNRFRLLFTSFWEALAPLGEKLGGLFGPVLEALGQALSSLLKPFAVLIGWISGKAADTGASNWSIIGKVLGTIVYVAAMAVAFALRMVLAPVQLLGMALPWLVDKFLWLVSVIADLPGLIADALYGAFSSVVDAISNFSLYDAGAKLLSTFADGIMSMLSAPADAVRQALDWVGRLLPHSDAEEGPLSSLTASGMATLSTMGQGMQAAAPDLRRTLDDALGQAVPALEASAEVSLNSSGKAGGEGSGGRTTHISIASLALPGVTDAQGFVDEIQRYLEQYDA